ncbi:MAG: hypothetical protein KDA84_18845 [Planctomycetaceae bacterium]|nr:hypothetical protein [Planctomycetaceae bacterium]
MPNDSESLRILVLGEYDPSYEPHRFTDESINHAVTRFGQTAQNEWLSTAKIESSHLKKADAIWVAPGSPYKNLDRLLEAIAFARTSNIPCLGTCGGFQHMVLEYARNVLGIQDAEHAEYDPYASRLFISKLTCSLVGQWMTISVTSDSKVGQAYGATEVREKYFCNFGVNPQVISELDDGSLTIAGADENGEVRIMELRNHPFFVGTLFVPQANSTPEFPHPLILAFIAAAKEHRAQRLP